MIKNRQQQPTHTNLQTQHAAADNAHTHNGHWTQYTHAYFMLDTTAILTINNQADIKHAIRNSVVCTKDGAFIQMYTTLYENTVYSDSSFFCVVVALELNIILAWLFLFFALSQCIRCVINVPHPAVLSPCHRRCYRETTIRNHQYIFWGGGGCN